MQKICFPFQETLILTISFCENWDLEWYSRSDVNSNDKLISVACLLHPVFLSDIFSDVIGMTSKCSIQLPKQFWLGLLQDITYEPPGKWINLGSVQGQ